MHVINVAPETVFQALSDSTRIRIVRLLAEGNEEACLCEIADSLDEPQYKLSRHLKVLRQSGLLSASKEGRWVYHCLVQGSPFFDSLISSIRALSDQDKMFSTDQKKFRKRIPQRDGGRCRTESVSSKEQSRKTR
ncbi:MAG: ArsR/SmtB family transcription factor [Bdellovibrionales bacterium]